MYVVRNAVRQSVRLQASLETACPSAPGRRISARTLDLSTHGVGLIVHQAIPAGAIVTITIDDGEGDGHEERTSKRRRRWRGHVVHSEPGKAGRRLGICFEEPEFGPQVVYEVPTPHRGTRRIRLDGPVETDSPERTTPSQEGRIPDRATAGARSFRSAAVIGLGIDQLLKTILVPAASGGAGPRLPITEDWPSLAIALAGLGAAGMLALLADRAPNGERPGVSAGMGLILGSLLSGLVDRLAFGDVRLIGSWSITPAHLLAASGAALAMGSLLVPSKVEGKVEGVGKVGARRPAGPGCPGLSC